MSEQQNSEMVLTQTDEASMLATMSKVRLVVVIDEDLRDALRAESALSGDDMAVIIERWIRENCAESVRQVQTRRAKDKKKGA